MGGSAAKRISVTAGIFLAQRKEDMREAVGAIGDPLRTLHIYDERIYAHFKRRHRVKCTTVPKMIPRGVVPVEIRTGDDPTNELAHGNMKYAE